MYDRMKVIKTNLTFMAAKELADKLAGETGQVHSVRSTNRSPYRTSFYVIEGMIGSQIYHKYTARPSGPAGPSPVGTPDDPAAGGAVTGREKARELLGLGGQQRGQTPGWRPPDSAEELRRLTGLDWHRLGEPPPRGVAAYFCTGPWEPMPPSSLTTPLWERAWGTREGSFLLIYRMEALESEEPVATIETLALPDGGRTAVENIVCWLGDLTAWGFAHQTDDTRLPYIINVPTFDAGVTLGAEAPPQYDDQPYLLVWQLRALQRVAAWLQERL